METTIGHRCTGGGASITDSPIITNSSINIHIHIHAGVEPLSARLIRNCYAIIGRRYRNIDNAAALSTQELQRRIIRSIED